MSTDVGPAPSSAPATRPPGAGSTASAASTPRRSATRAWPSSSSAGCSAGAPAVGRRGLRRGVRDARVARRAGRPRRQPAAGPGRRLRQPFPINVETLGGSIALEDRPLRSASSRASGRSWPCRRTLAAEARRGSLELVAVTPLGLRRIALEKLAAHLTVMAHRGGRRGLSTHGWPARAFGTLPGDEIPWPRRHRVRPVGRARRRSPRARSRSPSRRSSGGRGGRASPGRSCSSVATSSTATRPRSRASRALANLTWFGWTVGPPAARRSARLAVAGAGRARRGRAVRVGVEAFSRRDLGSTSRIPWPSVPARRRSASRGPTSRSFGERLPLALAWGIGIGLFAFVIAAAARALRRRARGHVAADARALASRSSRTSTSTSGRRVPAARRSSSSGSSWPGSPRRRSSPAGHRTRPAGGWRCCSRRPCRARAGRSRAASACSRRSWCSSVLLAVGDRRSGRRSAGATS